jgi:DNA-directed RNA polymerase subunit M/transcription elongation factor TFIIS
MGTEKRGFILKCRKCGAEFSQGKLFLYYINNSMWDDVEEGKIIIECNECGNKEKLLI